MNSPVFLPVPACYLPVLGCVKHQCLLGSRLIEQVNFSFAGRGAGRVRVARRFCRLHFQSHFGSSVARGMGTRVAGAVEVVGLVGD